MDKKNALIALSALGQDTRLDAFRVLIKAGSAGLLAGEISQTLGIRQNTLSTNLAILLNAGLVRKSREGRAIRYHADMNGMRDLLGFLMKDCCGGRPEACQSVIDEIACQC